MLRVIVSHRKTGFAELTCYMCTDLNIPSKGRITFVPTRAPCHPSDPSFSYLSLPTPPCRCPFFLECYFPFTWWGQHRSPICSVILMRKRQRFHLFQERIPKVRQCRARQRRLQQLRACSSPLASAALELVSPPPSPGRSRCSCGPITQPVLA